MDPSDSGQMMRSCSASGCNTIGGSALIGIIAAILFFSVLAASLLPMVGSSEHQAVYSHLADQAYLLAESGYRIVESRTDTSNYVTLDELDDATFTLSGNLGRIDTKVFSYFYPIPALTAEGSMSLTTAPPGSLPDFFEDPDISDPLSHIFNTLNKPQTLRIVDNTTVLQVVATDAVADSNGNITFTLQQGLQGGLSSRAVAYPATTIVSYNQATNTMTYANDEGYLFPLRNGRILLQGYENPVRYRFNNRDTNQFVQVSDPLNPGQPLNIQDNTPIAIPALLTNDARVHITGVVGSDDTEIRREVIYYNALRLAGEYIDEFTDRFDEEGALDNWQTVDGTVAIESVDGNQALLITSVGEQGGLVTLSVAVTDQRFARYRGLSGGYLSYDAQVKIGFYDTLGNIFAASQNLPISFATGLSFRLALDQTPGSTDFNGYGLSFLRGTQLDGQFLAGVLNSADPPGDLDGIPMAVLWMQTGDITSRNWLAYKKLEAPLYRTETEAEYPVATGVENAVTFPPGEPVLLECPQNTPCCSGGRIRLVFWSDHALPGDHKEVRLVINGESANEITNFETITSEDGKIRYSADLPENLTEFTGQPLQVAFSRSEGDESSQDWILSDLQIIWQWPIQEATLLVRLQEATVVEFLNGGTQAIQRGDRVYGETSGTFGTVIASPVLSSGNWTENDAPGTLLLNQVTELRNFEAGESFVVIGRANSSATVQTGTLPGSKENIIRAYFACADDYPRLNTGELFKWPPEDDHNLLETNLFHLLHWDEINDTPDDPDLAGIQSTATPGSTAIIRHHNTKLQSQLLSGST
ncbi:MAG: hypothetical protein KFF50_11345, partial [Desulfatitalea sp.]|nr:hypothetical protein [Desulfatitalea sp.]